MKLLTAIILIWLTAITPLFGQTPKPPAITVLQWELPTKVPLRSRPGDICTTFSVGNGLWLTANHCLHNPRNWRALEPLTIGGADVEVIATDRKADLALLRGPEAERSLKLARGDSIPGEATANVGFFSVNDKELKLFGPFHYKSYVVAKAIEGVGDPFWPVVDVYQGTSTGGHSGSPFLNGRGRVIGVVVGGRRDHVDILFSPPFEVLKAFLKASPKR